MAAVGDVWTTAPTSIANNAFLTIQPAGANEAVLHNVEYGGAMELYKTDGGNSIKIDSDTVAGSRQGLFLHATNAVYYQLKNVSGGAVNMSFDGIYTK